MKNFFIAICLLTTPLLFAYEEDPSCEDEAVYPPCNISDYYCEDEVSPTRSDNIPQTHVAWSTDQYLTGYVQALVDMHYYEFQVRVFVSQGIAYVFNLPCNQLISNSILCFIYDIPSVRGVESVEGCPEDYTCISETGQSVCPFDEMPSQTCQINGIWFPQTTVLFAPLVADPRQVTNSAAVRFNDDVIGKHVGAVTFGDEFGIYRWFDVLRWHGDLQFDIEAGIFAVFDLDHPDASLVNTDFFVAAMFSYACDLWSYRFRIWHLSSHLGDEFLLAHPGFDRRNLSDEGIDFFASYQLGKAIRLYAGIGDIVIRDHTFPEKPLYFEAGTEIRVFGYRSCYDKLYIQPFFAMHFRSWEEHNYSVDQTYVLGLEYSKIQDVGKKVRLFMEYHNGYCNEGQFIRERCDYFALRFMYGF